MTEAPRRIGCPICKHNQMDGTCSAYPQGIPFKFLSGNKHLERQADQVGDFVFEWASPEQQREKYLLAKSKREAARCTEVTTVETRY